MFSNAVVWITGASSGIGEALVKKCASRGARVVLSGRREEELVRVATEAQLPEDKMLILPFDVADYQLAGELTGRVISRFSRIDYLFNNAGVSSRALAMETGLEVDIRMMNTNYIGNIALSKEVLPHMIRQKKGHIIVTSSVMGHLGTPLRSSYAASKHALHGFYDTLREELHGTGVKITMISPGYIRTQVSVNAMTSTGEKFNKMSKFQANGMDPMKLADKVLRDVEKGKRTGFYGGKELIAIYLHRISPKLIYKILRKQHENNTFAE